MTTLIGEFITFSVVMYSNKEKKLIIVESGGSSWRFAYISTQGPTIKYEWATAFNAMTHSDEDLAHNMRKTLNHIVETPEYIYLYAAGVTEEGADHLHRFLTCTFDGIAFEVYDDMMAIVHGVARTAPGWMGILGTGANMRFWDGRQWTNGIPSFGYQLGDEGSGRSLVREVIKSYYRQGFSKKLSSKLTDVFTLSYESLIKEAYRGVGWPQLSRGYGRQLADYWQNPEIKTLVFGQLTEYFQKFIRAAQNQKAGAVYLIGGVAYAYKDWFYEQWKKEFDDKQLMIEKNCLQGLISYYEQHGY